MTGAGVAGGDRGRAQPTWFTELFAHRRWIRRTRPFPHIYARDVFAAEFYERLAEEYARIRRERGAEFRATAVNYSATGMTLAEVRDGPLALFTTREWHDLVAGVTGIAATGDVEGSVHNHPPGSPGGWPHHDLTPAWFGGPEPGPDEIRLPDPRVALKSGPISPEVRARELVRAVAVMFYLGNPGWRPGDGGETALYADIAGPTPTPALLVPPLDNSMVIFECTPRSWHTFAGGNTAERNSVVMWLHRPKNEAVLRWGGDNIVQW